MKRAIWMGISASATATRVLAMIGSEQTILQGQLSREPFNPRALSLLLEALALWQGMRVRAALCADDAPPSRDTNLYRAAFDFGGPLYSVDWVPGHPDREPREDANGHDFSGLRQLLLGEVRR